VKRLGLAASTLLVLTCLRPSTAAEWRVDILPAPGPIKAIDTSGPEPIIAIGGGWFRMVVGSSRLTLGATAGPPHRALPDGALPDGRIAVGKRDIARAWLAEPTERYRHSALGDAVEAGSLVVERRNGLREVLRLDAGAVFEDLEPRIAELDRSGREFVVVVKSYLHAGSALAVIGGRGGRYEVLAETPPIGIAKRWLNPAGIADFDGDGTADVALVRMPHALGRLELWSWRGDNLQKLTQLSDVANHAFGSRVQRMSAVTDFDGDGNPDLAIPSFDRQALRLIAFAPATRGIARVTLPARTTTEIAAIKDAVGKPAVIVGLENGSLAMVRMTR
jgi:hypothetical protein